jgi:hypothetical protein
MLAFDKPGGCCQPQAAHLALPATAFIHFLLAPGVREKVHLQDPVHTKYCWFQLGNIACPLQFSR